jgi:CHAD domain-containing protein
MSPAPKTAGLRYWMLRTLEECDHAAAGFSADPVHDLRVSLRRCRSLADGMMAMDPDPDWKAMKKTGKQLFQRLGALRDVQVMMEWVEKLGFTSHVDGHHSERPDVERADAEQVDLKQAGVERALLPAGVERALLPASPPQPNPSTPSASSPGSASPVDTLLHILKAREADQKREARAALDEFDRKQWKQWAKTLPARAGRIRPGSSLFKHLALERWTAARELHVTALRNRSQVGFHTLRIGIKRLRYIVENFLPVEHKLWGNDLKHMQDLLGEVHDLDVLWATAISCRIFPNSDSRREWHERIVRERSKRIEKYRDRTVGRDSLWNTWRAGLPQGKQIQEIALHRMKFWAKALDPDFAHSERVAALSLQLYDGLVTSGLLRNFPANLAATNNSDRDARISLQAAALLHDVGKASGNKKHHKESQALIQKHGTPLGWTAETMARAALVARFHAGALPSSKHKALRDLLPNDQKTVIRLAGILRLANALDCSHDGLIRRLKVESATPLPGAARRSNGFLRKPSSLAKNEALVIAAEGYADGTPTAQTVAAERYLLETVLRRPVIVKPGLAARASASAARS